MKLYELTEEMAGILGELEDAEGLEAELLHGMLDAVQDEFDGKIENIGKLVKSLEADVVAIKAERTRLADRQRVLENRAGWLKQYAKGQLELSGTPKVKGAVLTVSLRKSPPSCVVLDEAAVPTEYVEERVERRVMKKEIIAAFKETGEIIPGTEIQADNTTLSIR